MASHPQILGLSIQQNLKPTVQWLLDLGLTKSQVAKAVAIHPQTLGLSIQQNLKPTVQWLLDLGLTKSQVAKAVATFPPTLRYSVERNLKPTAQYLLDLGLMQSQVAKVVAIHPQFLGLSVEKNVACKVKQLQFYLPAHDVVQLIAQWPSICSYRQQRLEERLKVLAEQDSLAKLISAMFLTDEAFDKRFVIGEKRLCLLGVKKGCEGV